VLDKVINHRIGQALHTYGMLADGDRVLIAVSGGIDSLVLVKILQHWLTKAPINYQLLAVHLDMGFGSDEAEQVASKLARLGVDYLVEKTTFGRRALEAEDGRSGCFYCARQRRSRLFALAEEKNCNKLAMGHHQEDIIETFFLNLFYGGNLSTMVPKQEFFGGKLALIRPLAFLTKAEIHALGDEFSLSPVANPCPLSGQSKRQKIHDLLEKSIYTLEPATRATIFTALANVRPDYLLKKPTHNRQRRTTKKLILPDPRFLAPGRPSHPANKLLNYFEVHFTGPSHDVVMAGTRHHLQFPGHSRALRLQVGGLIQRNQLIVHSVNDQDRFLIGLNLQKIAEAVILAQPQGGSIHPQVF